MTKIQDLARNLSNEILEPSSPSKKSSSTLFESISSVFSSLPSINMNNIQIGGDRSVNVLSNRTTTINNTTNNESEEDEKKSKSTNNNSSDMLVRIIVGIAAFSVALYSAYHAGQESNAKEELEEDVSNWDKLKQDFDVAQEPNTALNEENIPVFDITTQDNIKRTNRIIEKYDAIMDRRKENTARKFILLGSSVFAGVVGTGGALVGSPIMMTAAVGMGVFIAIGFAFQAGGGNMDEIQARQIKCHLGENQSEYFSRQIPVAFPVET